MLGKGAMGTGHSGVRRTIRSLRTREGAGMAELVTGGAGENGQLTLKTDDDQVAARLTTDGAVTPIGGAVAMPGPGGRRAGGALGTAFGELGGGGGGTAITGIIGIPTDTFELGHAGRGATILVRGMSGDTSVRITGGDAADGVADATIGGGAHAGRLRLQGAGGQTAASITSDATGVMAELGGNGRIGRMRFLDDQGRQRVALDATLGQIYLTNENGVHTVILDAATGDVVLAGADVAEEFDVADDVEPGCVVRIDRDGRLVRTSSAYDTAVAGVISGRDYRPGVVLDRRSTAGQRRVPLAMVGKVVCFADASLVPIRAGELLTSSHRPGYAMAIRDRRRAYDAVIGKALSDLPEGVGTIPMLVGLR
jgi:hypothetical protein